MWGGADLSHFSQISHENQRDQIISFYVIYLKTGSGGGDSIETPQDPSLYEWGGGGSATVHVHFIFTSCTLFYPPLRGIVKIRAFTEWARFALHFLTFKASISVYNYRFPSAKISKFEPVTNRVCE